MGWGRLSQVLVFVLMLSSSLVAEVAPKELPPLPRPVTESVQEDPLPLNGVPPLPLSSPKSTQNQFPLELSGEELEEVDRLQAVDVDAPPEMEPYTPFKALEDEDRFAPWFEERLKLFLDALSQRDWQGLQQFVPASYSTALSKRGQKKQKAPSLKLRGKDLTALSKEELYAKLFGQNTEVKKKTNRHPLS